MAVRVIDSLGKPYSRCLQSARGPGHLADSLPGLVPPWAYGGDTMVDNNGQSQADSAPVQFGIFDWIDWN